MESGALGLGALAPGYPCTSITDVLHVGVKRDPTNFSTPAMRVTL